MQGRSSRLYRHWEQHRLVVSTQIHTLWKCECIKRCWDFRCEVATRYAWWHDKEQSTTISRWSSLLVIVSRLSAHRVTKAHSYRPTIHQFFLAVGSNWSSLKKVSPLLLHAATTRGNHKTREELMHRHFFLTTDCIISRQSVSAFWIAMLSMPCTGTTLQACSSISLITLIKYWYFQNRQNQRFSRSWLRRVPSPQTGHQLGNISPRARTWI